MMETKERIRCIHVNSAGGLYTLVVGGEAAYSGQDKLTTITEITKVVGIGPHGASYVYRVYCEDGDVKERIEISAEFVVATILEEVK